MTSRAPAAKITLARSSALLIAADNVVTRRCISSRLKRPRLTRSQLQPPLQTLSSPSNAIQYPRRAEMGDERRQQRVGDHLAVEVEVGERRRGEAVEPRAPSIEEAIHGAG